MTSRPSAPSSSSSSATTTAAGASIGSPSLNAPPIRMRHPLPAPPLQCAPPPPPPLSRSRSMKSQHHAPPSSSSYNRTSPRYSYPTSMRPSASPSTSPYYSSSHPSPVPSTSSSAGGSSVSGGSSLRTPPDLLVNGASVGHTGSKGQQLAVNTWNGQLVKPRPPRTLGRDEIRKRQSLLQAGLPVLQPTLFELPSPPPSPTLEPVKRPSKRRREDVEPDDPLYRPSPTTAAIAQARRRHGSLTPSALTSLAAAYRTAARELKHAADARASSISASRPSYLAARPTHLSALQQLDAVLLFCHAFWLDDLAAGGCIAKNWISLFGLLRYATNAHSDLGNDVLLGICRLVESAVLRKLHSHDSELLVKALEEDRMAMGEVAQMVQRQAADLERSDRLAGQARNLLSLSCLAVSHPELLAKAVASTTVNTEAAARTSVDPGTEEGCGGFAWPLDSISAMPHLVAFGRLAVAEHAKRVGVEWRWCEVGAD